MCYGRGVEIDTRYQIMRSTWICKLFQTKRDFRDKFERFKARLVTKVFTKHGELILMRVFHQTLLKILSEFF